ncbi:mitochondrial 54S ribosomal protein mL40 [Drepanopeziza brunnea f. sp. 'multigermtubi']|uniref:RING finger domain protein n=1 Tax=Marssonina brunnea f. sp. multigermtubi (strain MB_m1) TaxID=1072389 RepID=K1WWX9_MARBU|nr:RING finger domain protein [Drepanopeziza brunnea f. sp. 'multigermtubi' MB_m1]EKD13178.1 RING finger domain protein [Drepanopeziza brunnea f. sp. 'multigermtubi' MB_m1]KAJ5047138.1 hypothetical protein L3040_002980 [Drepanopeziza brunnea f. sp. 'multigermtubi']
MSSLLKSLRTLSMGPSPTPLALARPAVPKLTSPKTTSSRAFSTTPPLGARKNDKKNKTDPRITLIRYHMQHQKTPRPLRLSRLRALRHWTIHRAWMLARRRKREEEEGELMRMHQSIYNACEALRTMDAPGTKDAGRLYRIAMEKRGIFRAGGVPIEYARYQTDTPAREAWNHGWTR